MIIRIKGAAAAPKALAKQQAHNLDVVKKTIEKIASPKADEGLDRKGRIGIRLDPEVIAFFRSTGPGWQTRINSVLRREAGLENPVEKFGEAE